MDAKSWLDVIKLARGQVTPQESTKLGLSRDQVEILRKCLEEVSVFSGTP
jgi:hypothetical protein